MPRITIFTVMKTKDEGENLERAKKQNKTKQKFHK